MATNATNSRTSSLVDLVAKVQEQERSSPSLLRSLTVSKSVDVLQSSRAKLKQAKSIVALPPVDTTHLKQPIPKSFSSTSTMDKKLAPLNAVSGSSQTGTASLEKYASLPSIRRASSTSVSEGDTKKSRKKKKKVPSYAQPTKSSSVREEVTKQEEEQKLYNKQLSHSLDVCLSSRLNLDEQPAEHHYKNMLLNENGVSQSMESVCTDVTQESDEMLVTPITQRTFKKYPVTPFQQNMYNRIFPEPDEPGHPLHCEKEVLRNHTLSHLVLFKETRVDEDFLSACIKHVAHEYPIIRTHLYRNEKILDADVEALLPENERRGSQTSVNRSQESLDSVDEFTHQPTRKQSSSTIIKMDPILVESWNDQSAETILETCLEKVSEDEKTCFAFKTFIVPISTTTSSSSRTVLVFSCSTAIMDDRSMYFITRTLLSLYQRTLDFKHTVSLEESYDFLDFAFDLHHFMERHGGACRNAIKYMSQQFLESTSMHNEDVDRTKIREEMVRIRDQQKQKQSYLDELKVKKKELEREVHESRQSRVNLDDVTSESAGEEKMWVYVDRLTGEQIHINKKARQALVKTVLGTDVSDNNIVPLLKKHDVPEEVIVKSKAAHINLEKFMMMDSQDFEPLLIPKEEKRKLSALADFVRHRVKDSIEEQTKIKFQLERKIHKLTRELEANNEFIQKVQRAISALEDDHVRCHQLLHPQTMMVPIPIARLPNSTSLEHIQSQENLSLSLASGIGFFKFHVPAERVHHLETFGKEACNRRQKSASEDHHPDNPFLSVHPVHGVVVAALAVVLKHMCGQDKFVFGHFISTRKQFLHRNRYIPAGCSGAIVGPLTSLMPLKVDMTTSNLTFCNVFHQISEVLQKARQYVSLCSLEVFREDVIAKKPDHLLKKSTTTLSIQVDFISEIESKEWFNRGLTLDDLMQSPPTQSDDEYRNIHCHGDDRPDIKVILIHHNGKIDGIFWYDEAKIDGDRMKRYVERYMSVLENVEYGGQKITVSSLIGRFYQKIWASQ